MKNTTTTTYRKHTSYLQTKTAILLCVGSTIICNNIFPITHKIFVVGGIFDVPVFAATLARCQYAVNFTHAMITDMAQCRLLARPDRAHCTLAILLGLFVLAAFLDARVPVDSLKRVVVVKKKQGRERRREDGI